MKRATKGFVLLVAAQAVFLLAWAGYHERVRQTAPVILLKAAPVDPQDLLRGDYLWIRYDIGDPKIEPAKPSATQDIWVLLERRDRYHVVVQASHQPLIPGPDQILVLGTAVPRWQSARPTIEYGIERYFVPEGKGSPRFKAMEVEASVSPSHRLYIKRLLLDGQPYP